MGNVDKIMENEPPVSMNHSYHGFGRQLKVLDANTLTINRAVCRPAIILRGFCCDDIVAPFLKTASDTKKGAHQNAVVECADVCTESLKGSDFSYETVLNSRLEVLTFPKQIQTSCEPAVHADDRPEPAVHADARPRDSGPKQLRAMKTRSMSCRCSCLQATANEDPN